MFIIHIQHMSVSIAHMEAKGEYLDALTQKHTLDGPGGEVVEIKRTKLLNLLYVEERKKAAAAIWDLLCYLHYGRTKIGRLRVAHLDHLGTVSDCELLCMMLIPASFVII